MKTIAVLMVIAIAMVSVGTTVAALDPDGDLLASMTTQEFVDYYGMKYLAGDRSKVTVETLDLYAEKYAVYPTMDMNLDNAIMATVIVTDTPTTPVATPVLIPEADIGIPDSAPIVPVAQPPVADTNSNMTILFVVAAIVIVGLVAYLYNQQKKE